MENNEVKKKGRPKKTGQKNDRVVYVRSWTYFELIALKGLLRQKDTDGVVTKLISFYKRNNKGGDVGDDGL